jgi:hypothetical protein
MFQTIRIATCSLPRQCGSCLPSGGGHGELGYHLAKILSAKGIAVTLLQDSAAKKDKQPFASYSELDVEVVWGDLAAGVGASIPSGKKYDYVFDNFAKDPDTARDVAEAAKR